MSRCVISPRLEQRTHCRRSGAKSQLADMPSEPHPNGRSVSLMCANTHRRITRAVMAAGTNGGAGRVARKAIPRRSYNGPLSRSGFSGYVAEVVACLVQARQQLATTAPARVCGHRATWRPASGGCQCVVRVPPFSCGQWTGASGPVSRRPSALASEPSPRRASEGVLLRSRADGREDLPMRTPMTRGVRRRGGGCAYLTGVSRCRRSGQPCPPGEAGAIASAAPAVAGHGPRSPAFAAIGLAWAALPITIEPTGGHKQCIGP